MLADKIVNTTFLMMSTLGSGKVDRSFLQQWAENMIDISKGVEALEGSVVPESQRGVATGPNIVDFNSHRNRRICTRMTEGKPL